MEPSFTPPVPPRYSQRPFPAYRYLPFQGMPHPRNDPGGHSYGEEEEHLPGFDPDSWSGCESYLYGVDLFNAGYWWEAHEAWEGLWLAAGRDSLSGQFLQGLIQLAGAQLKRFTGVPRGAQLLTESAEEKLALAKGEFLGILSAELCAEARRCLDDDSGEYPCIRLRPSSRRAEG